MIDLGYIGPKFTWITRRGVGEEIWEKLDRAVCSMEWRVRFLDGFVKHLPRIMSDHSLLLLQLKSGFVPNKLKCFRFEAMWLQHKNFSDFINNNWNKQDGSIMDKVLNLTVVLKGWNRKKFGCIFGKKGRLLARIQGIQNCLSRGFVARLTALEDELLKEYSDVLNQEGSKSRGTLG
ncbi:hypothetical protein ACOSP7_025461 [Xanthoceras sorbifolium]